MSEKQAITDNTARGNTAPGDAATGDGDTAGSMLSIPKSTAAPTPAQWEHESRSRERWDIAVSAALLGAFLVLLVLVAARPTAATHLDSWVRDAVQRKAHSAVDHQKHWLWVGWITHLGGTIPAIPAMAVVAVAFARLRRSWRPVFAAAASYAVLGGAVVGLKVVVGRPGPGKTSLPELLGYFPSGHTANTVMCYGTCTLIVTAGLGLTQTGRWTRVIITTAMVLLAVAVGFSLVWLDYHWLSDVVGSYLLCGAALYGVARILRTDHRSTT